MEQYIGVLGGLWVILGIFAIFIGLIIVVLFIITIVARWKVFQKAGKAGWEAIIPFYNKWILVEISGLKSWFFFVICANSILSFLSLGTLLPFTGLISVIGLFFAHYNLAIKFGKEPVSYSLGLTILPFIFYPILAYGSAKYENKNVSAYGPMNEDQINNKVNQKTSQKNSEIQFCKKCGAKVEEANFCSKCGTKIQ